MEFEIIEDVSVNNLKGIGDLMKLTFPRKSEYFFILTVFVRLPEFS
jgi:hypothetical protein